MTDARNLESILAALAAQKATPPQGQPGHPPPTYPPPPANYQVPPPSIPSYQTTSSYPYPQPTSSGSLDLSSVQPVSSGSVSIQDAIARAKAVAAQNGVTPYDRPLTYSNQSRQPEPGRYRTSRSRSPPPRRDAFQDNFNPYRDERRDDRGGRGRDYGRDRSYSPRGRDRNQGTFSPRGANGSGRQRSPMRGGHDDNSETIQIESSLVGLIIGRQGENLRRVEGESHCRVQFLSPSTSDDQYRQCKITGPPSRRAEAKAMINRIIEDSGMGAIARAGLSTGRDSGRGGGVAAPPAVAMDSGIPPTLKDGEDCVQIMVPDRTVGLIIGRGGETIRDLQERSGCHINIVGESKSVNGLRPVNLIGPPQASIHAKDLIMEIVDSDTRNASSNNPQHAPRGNNRDDRGGGGGGGGSGGGGGGNEKLNDSIYVPSEAVGMIIGKGGETIREMQNQTGCKINVSQSSGPGETEREIGLVGGRDAIQRAKYAIEDKVEAVRQKNNSGGRGGGGRGQHRDYDNADRSGGGQPQNAPPAMGQPPAAGQPDPYAAYGGYQAYVAMWYQALAAQQQGQNPGQ